MRVERTWPQRLRAAHRAASALNDGLEAAVRHALRRASRVAVYHEHAAAELVEQHGLPRNRIVVIPKGIAAESVSPATAAQRSAARARFGISPSDDRPVVLSIGALTPVKNVRQAIAAVAASPEHGLQSIRDVATGAGRWALQIAHRNGVEFVIFQLGMRGEAYDFSRILLFAGDVLELVYLEG